MDGTTTRTESKPTGVVAAVARTYAVALAVAALLTPVLALAGLGWRSGVGVALIAVGALAPALVAPGVNQLMDLRTDLLMGRSRGRQTDTPPPAAITPLGMFLVLTVPLGLLGLAIQ